VLFKDRADAGERLAAALMEYARDQSVVVLGIPRGGVLVALQVAEALEAQLDVMLVRKLGVPDRPKLTMGAVAAGGVWVLNDDVVQMLHVSTAMIKQATRRAQEVLVRCGRFYRRDRPRIEVAARTVIVVDEGGATGASMRAAIAALRRQNPAEIVVALPTAPIAVCQTLEDEADAVVCLETPRPFLGIEVWYADFRPTTAEEVRALLDRAWESQSPV
jgi:predicted phosphoribosyltransferase